MALAGDALGTDRLSVAWRYLGMPSGAYHCLVVAAGALSYLTIILGQSSVAYRKDDCNESGTGHSFQYKIVYVAPRR
jgi:hypothetical protein